MAKIVGFICTAHGPQLPHDARPVVASGPVGSRAQASVPVMAFIHSMSCETCGAMKNLAARSTKRSHDGRPARACHAATEQLADAYAAMRADVAVIFGDDQHEISRRRSRPVLHGLCWDQDRPSSRSEEGFA